MACELLQGDEPPRRAAQNPDAFRIVRSVGNAQVHGDIAGKGQPVFIFVDELQLLSGGAGPSDRETFLRDLPIEDYTQEQLREWLGNFGTLEDMFLLKEPLAGGLSGGGYARFATHEEAAGLLESTPAEGGESPIKGSWSLSERILQDKTGRLRADVCNVLVSEFQYLLAQAPIFALALLGDSRKADRLRFAVWLRSRTEEALRTVHAKLAELVASALTLGQSGLSGSSSVSLLEVNSSEEKGALARSEVLSNATPVPSSVHSQSPHKGYQDGKGSFHGRGPSKSHDFGGFATEEQTEQGPGQGQKRPRDLETVEHDGLARAPYRQRYSQEQASQPEAPAEAASKEQEEEQDEAEAEDIDEGDPLRPCILVQDFPNSWKRKHLRQVFVKYGVAAVHMVEDPLGRAARIELKKAKHMAVAVKQMNDREVGDGKEMERCTLQCDLFGCEDVDHEQEEDVGVARRSLYLDELPMPKRPDVAPSEGDREVFLQQLSLAVEKEGDLFSELGLKKDSVEGAYLLRDASGAANGKAYVRFKSHAAAAACVTANSRSSVYEDNWFATWSESERAMQRTSSVYRLDVHSAFAADNGHLLQSVLIKCKVKGLRIFSEAFWSRGPRSRIAQTAPGRQIHFAAECEGFEFEEMRAALGSVLEAFHQRVAERLKPTAAARPSRTEGLQHGLGAATAMEKGRDKGCDQSKGKGKDKGKAYAEAKLPPQKEGDEWQETDQQWDGHEQQQQQQQHPWESQQQYSFEGEPAMVETETFRNAVGKFLAKGKGDEVKGKFAAKGRAEESKGKSTAKGASQGKSNWEQQWDEDDQQYEADSFEDEAAMVEAETSRQEKSKSAAKGKGEVAKGKFMAKGSVEESKGKSLARGVVEQAKGKAAVKGVTQGKAKWDQQCDRDDQQSEAESKGKSLAKGVVEQAKGKAAVKCGTQGKAKWDGDDQQSQADVLEDTSAMAEAEPPTEVKGKSATKGKVKDANSKSAAKGGSQGKAKDSREGGKAAGKQAAGSKGEAKGKRPLPSGKANQNLQTIRNHIDECELIMHAAYEMETYGQADQAQEEYSRGLRSFVDATKKMINEPGTDQEGLKQQIEQLLASRAVVLKERLDNAGLTIASLFAPAAKQPQQKKQGIIGRLLEKDSARGQESVQQSMGQEKAAKPDQQVPARQPPTRPIPARPRPSRPQSEEQSASQQPEQPEQQQSGQHYSQEWQDGGWNASQKDWNQGWNQQNEDWSQHRDNWKQRDDWNQSREEWSQRRKAPRIAPPSAPPSKGGGKVAAPERPKGATSGQRAQQSEGPPSKRPLPQAGASATDRRPPSAPPRPGAPSGPTGGKGKPQTGPAPVPSAVAKSSFLLSSRAA